MSTKDTPSKAFPEPTSAKVEKLHAEGVEQAIVETTKDAYKRGADEAYGGETGSQRFSGTWEVAHLQHLVDLPLEELKATIDGKRDVPLSEGQIAGLLEVERSGKNRTDVVKAFMKRLAIKSPYEVTAAGPAWTNDTTNITEL